MKKQDFENKIIHAKGIVKFPYYNEEEEKFTAKLLLTTKDVDFLNDIMELTGLEVAISEVEHNNFNYPAITIKTGYRFNIFDAKGNKINEEWGIYDGAKVIMKLNLKKYTYKEKKGRNTFTKEGITAYIMGAVVVEQGEPYETGCVFDEFKEDLESEFDEFNIES